LDPYRKESQKILAIFKELVPKSEVGKLIDTILSGIAIAERIEKASIDEAYMDLTAMSLARLLSYHPHLASVPADAPDGLDTPLPPAPPVDWSRAGNLVPTDRELADRRIEDGLDEVNSDDEADEHEHERRGETGSDTWEDWALCMGAEIMAEVRKAVWDRLHYTCSAGIAHNKAMAKVCLCVACLTVETVD
jgi:DNA polymerase eta